MFLFLKLRSIATPEESRPNSLIFLPTQPLSFFFLVFIFIYNIYIRSIRLKDVGSPEPTNIASEWEYKRAINLGDL